MRQLLLALLGRIRRGRRHVLGSGLSLIGLSLVLAGCASHSLMPAAQSAAIRERERALASHADAIQSTVRPSGKVGGLAFLDAKDGHLVVLPGDSPADAWAQYATSPESETGSLSAGTESWKTKRVPMGSGRVVLMNVPPLEMFLV